MTREPEPASADSARPRSAGAGLLSASGGDGSTAGRPTGSTDLSGLTGDLGLDAVDPGTDPLPGRMVGDVRIVRLIGEGGMGRVYEGLQERPSRRVAVKVMRPGLGSEASLKRFRLEAEILGQLEHPGVARIFSAGSFSLMGATLPFIVMEFIPDAKTIVAHAAAAGLSLEERVALFAQACDAVACGHSRGVVHRDLKPANIVVDATGRTRVIDFGVARWLDESSASESLTGTGDFVGTLQYTSPEQCDSRRGAADARSDVYSLGVVLYELLTGQPPYDTRRLGAVEAARIVAERMPPPARRIDRRIPPGIDRIVTRCLRKDPGSRFADAGELAAALRSPQAEGLSRRRAVLVGVSTAAAAALTVAAAVRRRPVPGEFKVTFDLRQPPGAGLIRASNARIYREPFGEVLYWAPIELKSWAEVVYRVESPFPIADVELSGFGVMAWNLHGPAAFDPEAAARLEISPDGRTWTPVSSSTPAGGNRSNDSFTAAVRGARQAFFRASLYETNSWNRHQVHRAQFLRSEPDLGRMPAVTLLDRPR